MKKCDTCKYRRKMNNFSVCDYATIKLEPRGCDPENCDKYEEGKHYVKEVRFLYPKERK